MPFVGDITASHAWLKFRGVKRWNDEKHAREGTEGVIALSAMP